MPRGTNHLRPAANQLEQAPEAVIRDPDRLHVRISRVATAALAASREAPDRTVARRRRIVAARRIELAVAPEVARAAIRRTLPCAHVPVPDHHRYRDVPGLHRSWIGVVSPVLGNVRYRTADRHHRHRRV